MGTSHTEEEIKQLLDKAEQTILGEVNICNMKYKGNKEVQSYAHGQVSGLLKATELIFNIFGRKFPNKDGE